MKKFSFILICMVSIILVGLKVGVSSASTQLKWNKIASFQVDSYDQIRTLITNKFIYVFFINSHFETNTYYYAPIDKLNIGNSWKKGDYPKDFYEISLASTDNYLYFLSKIDQKGLYVAKINEDGHLSDFKRQYYESGKEGVFFQAYGKFYQINNSRTSRTYYEISNISKDGSFNKWKSHWFEPRTHERAFATSVFNSMIFISASGKSSVAPIEKNGNLGSLSFNAEFSKDRRAISSVASSKRIFLLLDNGEILSGEYDDNGTIYEWVTLGNVPITPSTRSSTGEISIYCQLSEFNEGLNFVGIRKEAISGTRRNLYFIDVFSSTLSEDETFSDPAKSHRMVKPSDNMVIKPESKIKMLDYFPSNNELLAWDHSQKSLLVSKDSGKTWDYTPLSWEHDEEYGYINQIEKSQDPNEGYSILFRKGIQSTRDFIN